MCEMHEENHAQLINGHKLLGVKRSGQNQPFLELEHLLLSLWGRDQTQVIPKYSPCKSYLCMILLNVIWMLVLFSRSVLSTG